jgi:LPXTG-site transpeptidase (sortase) family protein
MSNREKSLKNIARKFLSVIFTLAWLLGNSQSLPVQAAAIVDTSLTQPTISGSLITVQAEQPTDYLAPTNTYDDDSPTGVSPTYIFVTQKSSKIGTTSITFEGKTFPVTTVVSNGNDLKSILRANTTFFFDDGTYNDSDSTNYFGFSLENLSLVGLTAGTVKITRSPDKTNGIYTIERNGFNQQDIYLENLIFDGGGYNMDTTNSHGYYFFHFPLGNGSTGFVMKNCTIQNVGASSSSYSNKNVAMNFVSSSGQHNFENITFKNIETQLNYGILSFNDATGNYFKNITFTDDKMYGSSTYSIKLEHSTTTTPSIPLKDIKAVFSGTLSLPISDTNHKFIYIQDFGYGNIVVPQAFRYAQYSNNNGGTSSAAINVYQNDLPAVTSSTSILDLQDKSWLVQQGKSISVNTQLTNINTTIGKAGAKAPEPNIKLVADSTGKINGFTVPDFGTHSVNIVAESLYTDLFSSTNFVPVAAAAVITLPKTTASKVILYNFDFDTYAKYTLQEAINGINPATTVITDPNEGSSIAGYPSYSSYAPGTTVLPKVVNATKTNFGNCKFTSLVNKITITNPPTSLTVGSTFNLTGQLASTDDNSYTASGISTNISGSADDQSIHWYSNAPVVASVDLTTGLVTALSVGSVTVYAKAVDANNNGEIDKPYASFSLTIGPAGGSGSGSSGNGSSPSASASASAAARAGLPIPITGFAPGVVTQLPAQSQAKAYASMDEMWVEIPSLNVESTIIGVPLTENNWDVSWLGMEAGWLNGTAFPTHNGNAVLTGHLTDANGLPGPFAHIDQLKFGDQIIIHAWGQQYIYEVRETKTISSTDSTSVLKHQDSPWITLLTCRSFDEKTQTYLQRFIVRAVLTEIK